MEDIKIINLTPENIADYGVCGYKNVTKHRELGNKIEWFKKYYPKGLRIKIIFAEKGGYQGMVEYIPGEYAHRPVNADGYMLIHCIFVGFKNEYKKKGYGSLLIDECIKDSQNTNKKGIAVVTRKGPFMAGSDIFIKKGFSEVDKVKPDFSLMVKKFDAKFKDPEFKHSLNINLEKYGKGLVIMRSPQCPYTEKNVNAILESAKNKFNMKTKLIDLDLESARNTPCAFGTFCIICDNQILSHHPISKTRFENIIRSSGIVN